MALEPGSSLHDRYRIEGMLGKGGMGAVYVAFDQTLHADRLIVTEIDADFDGDTHWAAPDPAQWRESAREHLPPAGGRHFAIDFVTYLRRG